MTIESSLTRADLPARYQHRLLLRRPIVRHNIDLILASTAIVEGAVLVSNDGIFRTLAELEPRLALENWAA